MVLHVLPKHLLPSHLNFQVFCYSVAGSTCADGTYFIGVTHLATQWTLYPPRPAVGISVCVMEQQLVATVGA